MCVCLLVCLFVSVCLFCIVWCGFVWLVSFFLPSFLSSFRFSSFFPFFLSSFLPFFLSSFLFFFLSSFLPFFQWKHNAADSMVSHCCTQAILRLNWSLVTKNPADCARRAGSNYSVPCVFLWASWQHGGRLMACPTASQGWETDRPTRLLPLCILSQHLNLGISLQHLDSMWIHQLGPGTFS